MMTAILSDGNSVSPPGSIIIELPLKPKKKMISLRLDEETLFILDKFIAYTGEYTRTLLIKKVVEALAKGLRESGYRASKLELRFIISNSNGDNSHVSIVIPLKNTGQ